MAKRKKSKTATKKVSQRNLWTAKELNVLRKLATRHSVQKIADMLGRSVAALRFKAHVLAISLRPTSRTKVRVPLRSKRKK